ncbi:Rossmann-fold NAD(P)-binding domain-containing protein [Caldovatus aquaticus]|uniref:SDR family NAD(P)-dependent oxidoreductase n=1 Tax=Caldovatus aquaticus TaxID=2865671 RepID=A0ABS7F228_9PROT|nr:SDR family NAD(P)-dependent oxidoreductase [Caldovatus aquaticus]MBW8269032.1 SDR family NAD(P)-dependent oxidoreductase [Caldovatus aquaticus]
MASRQRLLLVCGLGYAGMAVAREATARGWRVAGTVRDPHAARRGAPEGVRVVAFGAAAPAFAAATHLLVTAPPGEAGDPVIAAHRAAILAAPRLRWIGYLSTTGVYGDRGGGEVDEATPPAPAQPRSRRRLAAEEAWRALAAEAPGRPALDLFRTGGIYGPGRSVFAALRAGTARRIVKPGHAFARIHRDDLARAVAAAAGQPAEPGRVRVLHLVDDEPAENAAVVEEAARLLGLPPPPAVPFAEAAPGMSPEALSFWAENRRVANARTKAALGLAWRYPGYREGLRAILAAEAVADGGEPAGRADRP